MSYLVLARKWRPQRFEEIIGQQQIAHTLANAIKLDRIGHAFLFSGPRGVGKTSAARILSKALNCAGGPTPEPCNVCQFCKEITTGNALDVFEIDGASNRGIDEIRELRENVRYAPAAARFKIIIIDEVHMLTREAFNALLKTLEEPPPHVKFIMATTELHKVPVTIVSRCQRYDFKRIRITEIAANLSAICARESIEIEDRTVTVLARMAEGSMRDGLSLLDQAISFSGQRVDHVEIMQLLARIDPQLIMDIFLAIGQGHGAAALARFREYMDSGGDAGVFVREMMEMTRDLMAGKLGAEVDVPGIETILDAFEVDQLERIFKVLLDLETALRTSEMTHLVMDVALIRMCRIRALKPLEEIITELRRFRGAAADSAAQPVPAGASPPKRTRSTRSKPADPAATDTSTSPAASSESSLSDTGDSNPGEEAAGASNSVMARIIDAIPDENPNIKTFLGFGAIVEQGGGRLVLGFRREHSFQMEFLDNPERLGVIQAAAREVTGQDLAVSLAIGREKLPLSIEDQREQEKKKLWEHKLTLAMSHPDVSGLVQRMDGKIRTVQLRRQSGDITEEDTQ